LFQDLFQGYSKKFFSSLTFLKKIILLNNTKLPNPTPIINH
jgi:hypothetical protein